MKKPKIVAMYRIKNEERWIAKSLESIREICSEIVILDDGSTDKTVEVCSGFDNVTEIHRQKDLPLDEARDKNKLLQIALKRNPDILFALDGDEIVMPGATDIINEELFVLYPDVKVFEFQFLTLWDKPNQIRYDGLSSNYWQKRLFRLKDRPNNLQFESTPYEGNLHCGSIPPNTTGMENPVRSRVKILHCASLDDKLRQQKYEWYNRIDPNNHMTDNYIHMIGGRGRFSGPRGIEFKKLPPELFVDVK